VASYEQLKGVPTWYERHGDGDALLLLHPGGAGVGAGAFAPNLEALAERFRVYTPERRAHGHTPDVAGPITFDQMAEDTIAFLETVVGGNAHLVGCSDGATVALLVALRRPDLVRRLVLVAGVFHHDGWVPRAIDPSNEPPEFLKRQYDEDSPDGIDHYPIVVAKLAQMHLEEPTLTTSDLFGLPTRTLVMVGDDDEVTLEHAVATFRAVPDGELMVVPGTSHGLLVEKPALCNEVIVEFLTTVPVETMAPIRRAGSV